MPRKINPSGGNTPVRANHHPGDTRTNIPTAELESFARSDEKRPQIVRYPRDPSLDPQLVWKGKDEQDSEDLAVPAVPVYIQETIDPLALVEELRAESQGMQPEAQLDLFGPFTDLSFEEKVDFYRHPGKWTNRMILGDSLLVMASLAEKESLKGQVQTIYIDPPYGIKFGSNWQVSTRKRDVRDGKAEDLTRQPEQVRAYRDTWELGIHSYLSYLRDRLVVARELLTESGSIFVQIGDENVHLVRSLLDEVFGTDNFVAMLTVQKTGAIEANLVPRTIDYLLLYARDRERVKYRQLYELRKAGETSLDRYDWIEDAGGATRRLTTSEIDGRAPLPSGRRFRQTSLISSGASSSPQGFDYAGQMWEPKVGNHWKNSVEGLRRLAAAGRMIV